MENKRKIWVRVAAFMAAIICCVICVVPAYAEETDTETAQEQEEKLNAMVGADVFRAADHVVDLNYRDIGVYVVLDSENVNINYPVATKGYQIAGEGVSGYFYVSYVTPDGVSHEYGQVVTEVRVNITDTVSDVNLYGIGGQYVSFTYVRSLSEGFKISRPDYMALNNYDIVVRCSQGSSWEGYCVLSNTTPAQGGFYTISDGIYDPSQMLSYNLVGDSEEVYNQGYNTGYGEGYTLGYTSGKTEGEEYGYRYGHEEGFGQGLDQGYRTGYDDGMQQTSLIDGIKSLFRAPMEFVESALNFEIFGINMASTVKVIITAMMIALVVVVVWKAVK